MLANSVVVASERVVDDVHGLSAVDKVEENRRRRIALGQAFAPVRKLAPTEQETVADSLRDGQLAFVRHQVQGPSAVRVRVRRGVDTEAERVLAFVSISVGIEWRTARVQRQGAA